MNTTTNTGFGKLVAGGIVAGMGLLSLLPGAAINTLHYTAHGFNEVAVSHVGTDLAAASLLLVSVGLVASYFMQHRRAYAFA